MKKLIAILAGLGVIVGAAVAQEYKSRQPYPNELARVAGVTSYVQDEYLRRTTPRWVTTSLSYDATNWYDGVVFVRTNGNVTVFVALPNPTNNVGRRYEVSTGLFPQVILTNKQQAASSTAFRIIDYETNGPSLLIPSNKVAVAYSTGTNWTVYVR
jgi:hypothetical protein